MAKKNSHFYFPHDSNARNSDRLIKLRMRHGAAGYGVFFMIIERLREETEYMSVKDYNMIAFDLRVDASLVKSVVEDFGLFVFTEDGKYFYSESLCERMSVMDKSKSEKSAAGRKGMEKRWGRKTKSTENDNSVITELSDLDNNKNKINNKKENKFSPPLTPQGGDADGEGSLEEKIEEYKNHKPIWKDSIRKKYKISSEEIDGFLEDFMLDMKCRDTKVHKVAALFDIWLTDRLKHGTDNRTNPERGRGAGGYRSKLPPEPGCGLIE